MRKGVFHASTIDFGKDAVPLSGCYSFHPT
jgi:hypothetical protein